MLQCPRCGNQYPDDVHICPKDFMPLRADETVADVPRDRLIGRVFDGKYRLDEPLGGGGMGTVYRATHVLIDRPIAIKVLSQRFVGDETAQQRFHREAKAAGRMQHPNAVSVTDFGATSDGYLYIVMELLEGQTLRDLLAREAPLDTARAVSIMLQTSAAVGAAHDAGLIHRDLKPANIFIVQRPDAPVVVKVLDFGVAKFAAEEQADEDFQTLTQVGALIGTPRYMSPEQCAGKGGVAPASDIYSLGIIFYEMLSGTVPFNADTPLAIAFRHVTEPPPPLRKIAPSVPPELDAIVARALAKHPHERFVDGNALRNELLAAATKLGLEHSANAAVVPSYDDLRSSGAESPSGSLVIDLETLRQVQSAAAAAGSAALPTGNATRAESFAPARREISRLNIGLSRDQKRKRAYLIIAVVVLVAVFGSGVLAARWWRGGANAAIPASASPSPTASPAATESPSPTASPSETPVNRRSQKRGQPSKVKKVWDKVKGIFK